MENPTSIPEERTLCSGATSGDKNPPAAPPSTRISQEEIEEILQKQDSRKVSPFEATKLEKEAKRNWDIFYKRNETRFFKDRHWTLREFQELLAFHHKDEEEEERSGGGGYSEDIHSVGPKTLLEIGCGVGNFAFPILEELDYMKVFACDFSPRAVDFVKSNPAYDENRINAFVCDITETHCFSTNEALREQKVDFISMIFVLSAISPDKHGDVVTNLKTVSKPGTVVCFRDYGRYDMAQLRFKGGKKIQDNFYVRRDGTRAYYFTPEEVVSIFTNGGAFKTILCEYVHRRTVNVKEQVDVGRIFVQGKFIRL